MNRACLIQRHDPFHVGFCGHNQRLFRFPDQDLEVMSLVLGHRERLDGWLEIVDLAAWIEPIKDLGVFLILDSLGCPL